MTIIRLLTLILLILPFQGYSQGGIQFGVDWVIPEEVSVQREQLRTFKNLGLTIIQVEGIVDQATVELIQDSGFNLWVSTGVKFYRPSDFPNEQQLVDNLTDPLYYYRNLGVDIQRYTLFEHPLNSDGFSNQIDNHILVVKQLFDGPIDVLTVPSLSSKFISKVQVGITKDAFSTEAFAAILDDNTGYVYVLASAFSVNAARQFRDLLLNDSSDGIVWIFDSKSLIDLDSSSDFAKVLKAFAANEKAVIALGPEVAEEDSLVFITIVILILVTLFSAIFATNASYQRSIIRYLLTHNFYINDVMQKRTRFTGAVPLSWGLSVFFAMLLTWITIDRVFNDVTTEMMLVHYPVFGAILNDGVISVLLFAAFSLISIQLISFIWVASSTFGKSNFSQITQIILIPHQLIIPLTIVASLTYLNTDSPVVMMIFYSIYLLIVLISTPLTCIDILRHSQGKKGINWITGPILYTILVISLIVYVVKYTAIPDTLSLILELT